MHMPKPLRRQGVFPGLVRLVSLILECISIVVLATREEVGRNFTTDYLILDYLILVDTVEIALLAGQAVGWFLPALPMILAEDILGGVMLMCSRDWYGYWHWHGPYYSLSGQIGLGIFITLPRSLRLALIAAGSSEYWSDNREDTLLAAERQFLLLPR